MERSTEPRPTLASVFADDAVDITAQWLEKAIKPLPINQIKQITVDLDEIDPKITIRAMLSAAAGEVLWDMDRLDAYRIARNFEQTLGWPVDGELIHALHINVTVGERSLRTATMRWVMRSGWRFPVKVDETLTFKEDGGTRAGKVISIEPGLAQAVVESFGGTRATRCTVFAEDVVVAVASGAAA